MITLSEQSKLAIANQLHHDYFVGLQQLGLLIPDMEYEYRLAVDRERIGKVKPFSINQLSPEASEAKWLLIWGFHQDRRNEKTGSQEYGSEQDALEGFEELKQSYESEGFSVWYIRLFSPTGDMVKIA